MDAKEIRKKIIEGEIDPNNMELFYGDMIKACILYLNDHIKLRDKSIPHYIMNTGDEIMFRDAQNYTYSRNEITGEDNMYSEIPRCIIDIDTITTMPDQLSSPYVRGVYELTYDDTLYEFTAEVRRMPCSITINLTYYIDSYTDCLRLSQKLLTELGYIRLFKFCYLGEDVMCSMKLPDSASIDHPTTLSFDTDNRFKKLTLSIDIESNLPIYDNRTTIESDMVITKTVNSIGRQTKRLDDQRYKKQDDVSR